jgi:2-haloacid dehalogenase
MIKNIVFDIFDVLIDPYQGPIHETVDILMTLKDKKFPLYAITNLSADHFQTIRAEYPFLRQLDGVVVSGEEQNIAKPDPQIFHLLCNRYNLNPAETLFIDDKKSNVDGAWAAGLCGIHFLSPAQLEKDLMGYGVFENQDTQTHDHEECGNQCHHHH